MSLPFEDVAKEGLGFLSTIVTLIAKSIGATEEERKALAAQSDEVYERMRSKTFGLERTSDERMARNMRRAAEKDATGVLPPAEPIDRHLATPMPPATDPAFDTTDEETDPGKKNAP